MALGSFVLILVLVEHTLRVPKKKHDGRKDNVLILVLVEHTLRGQFLAPYGIITAGLNPCFSGTYSQRLQELCIPQL